jgi:CIC family chloride channel protein
MFLKDSYQKLIQYLANRFTRVQIVMFVATLVGICSGLIAVLLKSLVHFLQEVVYTNSSNKILYLIFPVIGIVLSAMVIYYFFKRNSEKGISMVLKHIAKNSSVIPLSHSYKHVITSAFTVGLGGSAGLEGPIVATGSAIGSNISRISDLNYQERTLLIACGAAAGIAAVFNAPLAGVIFAAEVLLVESAVTYFIPLLISAAVGALCSEIILHEDALFKFKLQQTFDYTNVPFYALMGIFCGFVSLYYAKAFKFTEHFFQNLNLKFYFKAIFGGLALVGVIFLLPPLFGEGYTSVHKLAQGKFDSVNDNTNFFSLFSTDVALLIFTGLIVLFKPIAAGITLGSGGNGGNFAPSLFTGAFLGFFFSRLVNSFNWIKIPEGNFSLVAMAGVLSGVMYAPLTAIFLIAEITSGYELFIPLMIVSAISFFIVKSYQPHSMETRKLAEEGQIFTHEKEKNILVSISIDEIIQKNYQSVYVDQNLDDLVKIIKQSDRNIFVVLTRQNKFAGIIELNDIKDKLFESDKFKTFSILKLMKLPKATLNINQEVQDIMDEFDKTQSWYLPVLSDQKEFIGFISKTKLFDSYRSIISSTFDLYESK